jgi:DNA-directed RNA polymerase specialized sigma24 family protein
MDVCHQCDVRQCINPQHLFVGTRADNMADAVRKNRQAKGFALPHTKLSAAQRDEIVKRAKLGEPYKKIAQDFGLSRQHVGQIAINQGVRRNGFSK